MSDKNASQEPVSDTDEQARKAAADSLRRQIENLKDREPRSLNEFAERKVAEDRAKKDEKERE
jgi:hypothetical protein